MRPYPEEVLKAIQTGIGSHFAPELTSTYAQAQFAFSMLLFGVALRDHDSAVPDLIDSNRALREMLAEAAAALTGASGDGVTAARDAVAALPPAAPSLRLSDLRRENESLRAIVSALAPVIEPAADVEGLEALRPVRERTYSWLSADARRRIVPILSA